MKILASDFDGTLYIEDKKILEKNIIAIKRFISQGNIFCIITGRNYTNLKFLLSKYKIPYNYLICEDGAKIFNNMDYCIDTINLNDKKVATIEQILKQKNQTYFLDDGYNETENIKDCVKIAVEYQDKNKALDLLKELKDTENIYAYLSKKYINIVEISVNKYNALKKLLNLENLPYSSIYVIGDSENDYEMLQNFEGAIMKNHHKKLEQLNKKEYHYLYQYIEELSKN